MNVPYPVQRRDGDREIERTLSGHISPQRWLPSASGPESGFRNKAKLVVAGTRGAPTLGILDEGGHGVDLTGCGLYEPGLSAALPVLRDVVADAQLTPYDVPSRNGELKNLLVTHSPDDRLMLRFVLRSTGQLPKVERAVPALRESLPGVRVVSVNLLPEHRAVLEGEQEMVLTEESSLPMRLNDLTLHLRPNSFFQTNTGVAAQLYAQARDWAAAVEPAIVLDLFCGVGGFGLHCAGPSVRQVVGVEVSADAVQSARRSAAQLQPISPATGFEFIAGDAYEIARETPAADLVIVNPPRRGIGADLCGLLESSTASHILYSSCNPRSLAGDLDRLPGYEVERARVFHMFPQSTHYEVLALLRRR